MPSRVSMSSYPVVRFVVFSEILMAEKVDDRGESSVGLAVWPDSAGPMTCSPAPAQMDDSACRRPPCASVANLRIELKIMLIDLLDRPTNGFIVTPGARWDCRRTIQVLERYVLVENVLTDVWRER